MMKIQVVQGDITTLCTDMIVNAANPSLMGGGGIDGAIHMAAGHFLKEWCSAYPNMGNEGEMYLCPPGQVRVTPSFGGIQADFIAHTVGPDCRQMSLEDAYPLLIQCYARSLFAAVAYGCKTIGIPAISTGIYGYPTEQAAFHVCEFLATSFEQFDSLGVELVQLVTFTDADYLLWTNVCEQIFGEDEE